MKCSPNFAVIGAGYWGKKVLAEYVQLANGGTKLGLQVVCDCEESRLRRCCEELSIPEDKLSNDYKEVLASANVDAVHICTPNETHHRICREALLAGKYVLLEKPMTLNARDAWELVGLAEHKGLILQVGHIFRFNNALKKMRDLIALHYFGNIYYLKLRWTTLAPSPLNRDIIFDLGPHPIDIMNYVLKRWPSKVTCKARVYRRRMLEELAYFLIEFDDDLMAHVELSWLQPGKVRQLDVIGSKRSATVDCLEQSIGIYENGDGHTHSLQVTKNNTILDEIQHFAKSIQTDENSCNPGNVGAKNVAVLESLKRSLEENRTVKVDLRDQD